MERAVIQLDAQRPFDSSVIFHAVSLSISNRRLNVKRAGRFAQPRPCISFRVYFF